MNDAHLYNLLADASGTLEMQSEQIKALTPKAEAYERIGQVLDLAMGGRNEMRAYEADIRWRLKVAMEEIHAGLVAQKTEAQKNRSDTARAQAEKYPNEPIGQDAEICETATGAGSWRDPAEPSWEDQLSESIQQANKAQDPEAIRNFVAGRAGVDMGGTTLSRSADEETVIDTLVGPFGTMPAIGKQRSVDEID